MLNVPEIEMDLHNSGYKDICTLYIYLFIELAIYPFIYSRDLKNRNTVPSVRGKVVNKYMLHKFNVP